MLQILSTSNETATGPELVTNGDFSAVPLGSEEIVDGSFPNGSTAWSEIDGGSIVGNQMVLDCGTTTNAYTYQSKATAYTLGKSYQVTVTIASNTTGVSLILYPFSNSPYTSVITVGATAETHTISFVPDYTSGSGKTFVLRALSSTGVLVIDNVSVKEVSNLVSNPNFTDTGSELVTDGGFSNGLDDWSQNGNFTSTANQLICNVVDGGKLIYQTPITPYVVGKTYLYTFDIISISTGNVRARIGNTLSDAFTTTGSKSAYLVHSGVTPTYFVNYSSDAVIDNISVKELGGDWSLQNGWSIGDSEAIYDGLPVSQMHISQVLTVPSDKWFKISLEVLQNEGTGLNNVFFGAVQVSAVHLPVGTYVWYGLSDAISETLYVYGRPSEVFKISNITVQELGEGWTQGIGWTIGDSKAISAQALGGELITDGDFSATGSDVVINGTFATDTDWSKNSNWTISGGEAISDGTSSASINQHSILTEGVSYKISFEITEFTSGSGYSVRAGAGTTYSTAVTSLGVHTFYQVATGNPLYGDAIYVVAVGNTIGKITNVTAEPLGEDWDNMDDASSIDENGLTISTSSGSGSYKERQSSISLYSGKSYKVTYTIHAVNLTGSNVLQYYNGVSYDSFTEQGVGTHTEYITRIGTDSNLWWYFKIYAPNGSLTDTVTISSISVEEIATSYLTQAGILTVNRTYKFGYTISNYSAGTVSATDYGAIKDADEVVLDTVKVGSTDFSIKNIDGYFVGDIESVSAKLLGTYSDQSIYVTAADVQTIAQASVYYLVELTSMASKNSLYFLPSSVVANNGRYTKLNFTVISKDATPTPAVGIISFYDSVGGFDTYPMGFYEFKIYEQTSSTNLDPSLATGLLEKGFAFVRDFSGNMQELTDGFKEYNPTLTQYVYSK